MLLNPLRFRLKCIAAIFVSAVFLQSNVAFAMVSIIYTYDALGRVATALYDTGTCIVYSYDANGNRTAQTITTSGNPTTPVWGTGSWGCFIWS